MFGVLGDAIQAIGEIILSIPGKVADALKWLFDLVVDAVKGVASAIWNFFKDPFGSIVSAFDWLIDFLGSLIDSFMDMLKFLFLPSDGYFDKQFSKIQSNIDKKINITEYKNSFEQIKGATAKSLPMQRSSIEFLGVDFSVIGRNLFQFMEDIKPYSDPIIRGMMFFLLLLFNINNVHKLIRGTPLIEGGGDD